MIHYWMLLYVIGTLVAPSCSNTIAGFPSLEECEKSRVQLIAKLQPRKSACIEVTQAVQIPVPPPAPPESPPVDQQR